MNSAANFLYFIVREKCLWRKIIAAEWGVTLPFCQLRSETRMQTASTIAMHSGIVCVTCGVTRDILPCWADYNFTVHQLHSSLLSDAAIQLCN